MTNYLIQPKDLCMSDPMPFNQHWEARIPVPISDIDVGVALQNCYQSLKPGDLIAVASFRDKAFRRLREVADFRVVSVDLRKLEVVQVTETIKVPEASGAFDPVSSQNIRIVQVRGAFEVQDGAGNVIELFVDQAQAETFVASYNKITAPVVAKPQKEDRSKWQVKKSVTGKWTVRNENNELVKEFSSKADAENYIAPQQQEVA